jgi:drug/metabolite transporter (DMT)-like permease
MEAHDLAPNTAHRRAVQWLVLGTAAWGLSFPVQKMLTLLAQVEVPEASTWFLTSWIICVRSLLAAVLLLLWRPRLLRGLTPAERRQGLWLGLVGGAGLVLQADGLAHTTASTSAFLTQAYCILLPLWHCFTRRTTPGWRLVASTALVVWGIAILSGFNWTTLHMGRGEWETLGAALAFTFQIILLERPVYASNRPLPVTALMFAGFAAWSLPVALATAPHPQALLEVWSSAAAVAHLVVLAVVCTVLAYGLMTTWQPKISATEAGLIYCFEPVCASFYALFLPAWLATATGVAYANETLTTSLVVGGLLITLANVILQIGSSSKGGAQGRDVREVGAAGAGKAG